MSKIKNILLSTTIAILYACSTDNGEEILVDCSSSDLKISLSSKIDPGCNEAGSITVTSSGGKGVLSFRLNSESLTTDTTFLGLEVGDYTITAIDENDCEEQLQVSLVAPGALQAAAEVRGCGDENGEIIVEATGGDGEYTYSLNNGEFVDSNVFSGLGRGNYFVTIRDGKGCEVKIEDILLGVSLERDIMPIINASCATSGCHGTSQSPLLVTRQDVIGAAQRIKVRTTNGTMPPNGELSEESITAIANWVDCGALNN